MDLNLIKKLVKILNTSDITELEVEKDGLRIKIGKKFEYNNIPISPHLQIQPLSAPQKEESITTKNEDDLEQVNSANHHEINSPIVGTFYRSPTPDQDPFVKIGDVVKKGTVLCIVEAMKLMNEIESDVEGKIVKIIVDNGNPVEYNQPLFLIEA